MSARLNYFQASPKGIALMMEMEQYIKSCYKERNTIDKELVELIKIRVSQINGCAYCLDMHTKDSIAANIASERINLVATWNDAHCYTDREKLALKWAELNTKLPGNEIRQNFYDEISKEFSAEQIVDLTIITNAINSWNRFGVSFLPEPGVYKPGDFD